MTKVIGGFFLRSEGDGCLTGKYVNSDSLPYVEAAKLIGPDKGGFCGTYDTVWLETGSGKVNYVVGTLTIQRSAIGNYELEWLTDGTPLFQGVGMLSEGLMIGGYWSVG